MGRDSPGAYCKLITGLRGGDRSVLTDPTLDPPATIAASHRAEPGRGAAED
jgi:hypothetical protein